MIYLRRFITIVLIFTAQWLNADHPVRHVKKVILWGHPLHSHTHSYIHWGFFRAFKKLGYETYWFDGKTSMSNFDFNNVLFITEGQVDSAIPIRDNCYYIIHNCKPAKYQHLLNNGRAIILQVYTHDCLTRKEPSFDYCFHYNLPQSTLYMPWATDLLPDEIEAIKQRITLSKKKKNSASFIGSISSGYFGNQPEINQFKKAIEQHGIEFYHGGVNARSMEENIACIQASLLAPALQGSWQCKQGYIPCRIFKNISYGAMGITNSATVYRLLNKAIVYNPNAYQLGHDAIKRLATWTLNDQYALMDLVKEKHTYINRIERLFSFFEMVHSYKQGAE